MKKFFYAMFVVLLMTNIAVAQDSTRTQRLKTRVQTITEKFDSIASNKVAIIDSISPNMGDTVLQVRHLSPRSGEMSYESDVEDEYVYNVIVTVTAIAIPFLTAIIIIFICLFIGYKRRKAKYRIIELAIEKGYELPEYLFVENGKYNSGPKCDSVPVDSSLSGNGVHQISHIDFNWGSMKSGIKWTATGIGLCLFFLFAGGLPMVGICSIILLIGVSKLVIAYFEQKNRVARYNYYTRHTPQSPVVPPPLPNQGNNVGNPENQG